MGGIQSCYELENSFPFGFATNGYVTYVKYATIVEALKHSHGAVGYQEMHCCSPAVVPGVEHLTPHVKEVLACIRF